MGSSDLVWKTFSFMGGRRGTRERRGRTKRRKRRKIGMSIMALTCMTGCIALVISAAKSATTHLLTWWTVPITALVSENVCVGDMDKGGLTFYLVFSAAKERERKREEERKREREGERERGRE